MRPCARFISPQRLSAAGLIVGVLALTAPAQSQTGSWTQKAPMSAVRGEVAAAVVDGKLYVLGGSFAGQALPRNEEYDPATDRWRLRAPLPQGRDHLGVAAVNGKIYTFGGFTGSVHKGAGDVVFEYDPMRRHLADAPSDEWSARLRRRRSD